MTSLSLFQCQVTDVKSAVFGQDTDVLANTFLSTLRPLLVPFRDHLPSLDTTVTFLWVRLHAAASGCADGLGLATQQFM